MTVLELVSVYGKKEFTTSAGDNLSTVVDKVYNSRDDVYYKVLLELNCRYDWDNIRPGTTLYYLPKGACDEYREYYSRW